MECSLRDGTDSFGRGGRLLVRRSLFPSHRRTQSKSRVIIRRRRATLAPTTRHWWLSPICSVDRSGKLGSCHLAAQLSPQPRDSPVFGCIRSSLSTLFL